MHVMIKDRIATRDNAVCVCVPHSNVRSAYSEGEQTEGAHIQHGGGSKGMLLQKFLNSEYLSA